MCVYLVCSFQEQYEEQSDEGVPVTVDDVRAFEMLRTLSQESNSKLVDIALRVIETRGDHA